MPLVSESEDDDGTILMSNVHHRTITNSSISTTNDEENNGTTNNYGAIPPSSSSDDDPNGDLNLSPIHHHRSNNNNNNKPSKGFYIILSSFIAICIVGLVFFKPTNFFATQEEENDDYSSDENLYLVSPAPSSLSTSLSTSGSTAFVGNIPKRSHSTTTSSSTTSTSGEEHTKHITNIMKSMPYPIISRSTYNDPLTNIFLPNIFHPSLLHPTSTYTTAASPYLKIPFPTGAFWTNLILHPTSDHSLSYPVVSYPYSYKWSPTVLQMSYPYLQRYQDDVSVRDAFKPDLIFGSKEKVVKRFVLGWDLVSVSLRFYTSSSSSSSEKEKYWETYIVQGAPYATINYVQTTPEITPISIFREIGCLGEGLSGESEDNSGKGYCKVLYSPPANRTPKDSTTLLLHGTQFLLHTNENLYWLLFASSPITLSFDTITKRTITSNSTYTGTLRFALVPPDGSSFGSVKEVTASSGVKNLVYHKDVYPIGGDVSWDFSDTHSSSSSSSSSSGQNNVGTISFSYNTVVMSSSSTSASSKKSYLLMLALPHHAAKLPSDTLLSSQNFDLEYNCIKGKMTPVIGSTWTYDEILPDVDFDDAEAKYALSNNFDGTVKTEILKQIKQDLYRVLPTLDENVYGFGKQVARLAQLVHIARRMNEVSSTEDQNDDEDLEGIAEEGSELLYSFLSQFLANDERDKLVYDANLGGMVTLDGLKNTEADFGNGRFNDHHFHYGYILYACAIMGDLNSTFVSEYGKFVDPILFDVAHNSYTGSNAEPMDGAFFPLARHKSWFDGHSFASGLFPFGNGKSQESSSEAVNCYYGAYLWSTVRSKSDEEFFGEQADKDDLVDFTRLLLATEIQGAKTYWHMLPSSDSSSSSSSSSGSLENVYTPRLAKNYMVGNLGMMDVTCSTWFGTEPLYVHMINFIPITAITSELFDRTYVQEEYTNLIGRYSEVQMAWRGYVVCDEAMVDPNSAWQKADDIYSPELDSALSRSQVLYWISTRKGFTPSRQNSTSSAGTSSSSSSTSTSNSALCYKNEKCAEQGLTGECCPASNGVFLGCCDSSSSSSASDGSATTASSSSCSSNEKCSAMGLEGDCCPAPGGIYLGCCDAAPSSSSSSAQTDASAETASTNSSSIPSSASCEDNEGCAAMGLTGYCCPAPGGVYLGCCGTTASSSAQTKASTENNQAASTSNSTASCSQNENCAAMGLTGECCPAPGGVYLGCCGTKQSSSSQQTEETTDQQTSSSSSCSQNEKCAATGLQGDCCPAPGGVYLGCCDEQR